MGVRFILGRIMLHLALALLLLQPAQAAAAPIDQVQAKAQAGLLIRPARLARTSEGAEVRGSVCRRPSHPATGRVTIHLQRRDAQGVVTDEIREPLAGALGPRDRACGFYVVQTGWSLAPGDTLGVCADRYGRRVCASPAGAD
jgi:hypothetical protein